jgi:ferric-dicitrate binding protein FerR (iron transport regulator)
MSTATGAAGAYDAMDVAISRYLDGALDAGELADFNRRLASDTSFAQRLYHVAHLHGALRELGTATTPESLFGATRAPNDGLELPISLPTPGASVRHRERGVRRSGNALLVAALFAAVCLAVLWTVWPKNAVPFAVLKQARSVWVLRDGNSIPASADMELLPGDSLRTANNGAATLYFENGQMKVELEGDAHLGLPKKSTPIAPRRLELDRGVLTMQVDPGAKIGEVVVATPRADVNARTTNVTVAASDADTRVDVHAGDAEFTRKSDGKDLTISTGQYAIAGESVEMAALPFAQAAKEKEPETPAVEPAAAERPETVERPAIANGKNPGRKNETLDETLNPWELNITGFHVVNAKTGERVPEMSPLFYGTVIEKRAFPQGFTIQAATSPEKIGSIVFALNGNRIFVANEPPYAVTAAKNEGFEPWKLPPGVYNLRATPFTKPNGQGKPGPHMIARFRIVPQKGNPNNKQGAGPVDKNRDKPAVKPADRAKAVQPAKP